MIYDSHAFHRQDLPVILGKPLGIFIALYQLAIVAVICFPIGVYFINFDVISRYNYGFPTTNVRLDIYILVLTSTFP